MVAPIRFLSGRQQQQKIGIEGSTENVKVLEVIGRVGIGTTIFEPIATLDVRGDLNVSGSLSIGGTTGGEGLTADNLSVLGLTTSKDLKVLGLSTFVGLATFQDYVVIQDGLNVGGVITAFSLNITGEGGSGGQADLDNLNVSGLSTFTGLTTFSNVYVGGASTFFSEIDANGGIVADILKVESLTPNRVVVVGTGDSLTDDANLTFDGTQLAVGVDLDVDGHTELDNLRVSGLSTFTSTIDADTDILVSGKIGIGTDIVPTAKFEVAGGDATFRANVNVYQDLFVAGNISVAGTSVTLDTEVVRVEDKDLVLGFTTTITPNDTTANHGGIAIASTEGSPLVPLYVAGINTLPDTYKQFMWVKSGTYAGMTTDAWVSNYAVSIGNTAIEEGVTLKVGTGTGTEYQIRMYGNTGIISASRYYGSGGFLDDIIKKKLEGITAVLVDSVGTATTLGIALQVTDLFIDNSNASVGYITAVGFGSTARYYFNDVTAIGLTTDANVNTSGIITAFGFNANGGTFTGDGSGLTGLAGVAAGVTVANNNIDVGTASRLNFGPDIDVSSISSGIVTMSLNESQNFTGIVTISTLDASNATIGIASISTLGGINTLGIGTIFEIKTDSVDGGRFFVESNVGEIFIITNTVTDGSLFSVNDNFGIPLLDIENDNVQLAPYGAGKYVGVGKTNPTEKLDVIGNVLISGNLGIGTDNPQVKLHAVGLSSDKFIFDSNNSLQIPAGTEAQKESVGTAVTGQIRFNTTNQQFEGFGVGNNWGSLGGVKDVDGDTYILAEVTAGSDEDQLYFYTGGNLSGTISSTTGAVYNVNVSIGTDTSNAKLTVDVGTAVTAFVIDGSEGQLFSVTNNLTSGSIFSVNDVYGVPSIDVDADGTIQLAPFGATEYVGVGLTNPQAKLHVGGNVNVSGVSTFQDDVNIGVGGTTAFFDISTGYVGINTTNPLVALDVAGVIREELHSPTMPVGLNDDIGVNWTKVEMGAGLETIYSLVYCGNGIVLAGSGSDTGDGDVYRSTDFGLTWTQIEMGAGIETILSLVYCGNGIVLAGSGFDTAGDGDVYKSTDFGLTWTQIEMGAGLEQIRSLVYCGNGIVLAGSGSGTGDGDIYRSDVGFSQASTIQGIYHQHLTGNIGIGSTQPTAKLDVDGGVKVTGVVTATDFNSTSDARLKTNVQVIEDPLEKVLQINGVSFNWIKDNKPSMGVIADNIQEVLPELVSDTDPKTVNYNGLIGLLIECVKHQQAEINILKETINNNN
jgi:hypothetical protein